MGELKGVIVAQAVIDLTEENQHIYNKTNNNLHAMNFKTMKKLT